MKTVMLALIVLVLLVGCGKKNPTASTPTPDPSSLFVSIDSVCYDVNLSGRVYYTLSFHTTVGETCGVMDAALEFPTPNRNNTRAVIIYPFQIPGGQSFSDNYLLTRVGVDSLYPGQYTLYVHASWKTWVGIVTGSFDR